MTLSALVYNMPSNIKDTKLYFDYATENFVLMTLENGHGVMIFHGGEKRF